MITISTMPFYKVRMRTIVALHQTSQIRLRTGNALHSLPPLELEIHASRITALHTLSELASRIQYVTRCLSHLLPFNSSLLLGNPRISSQSRLQIHTGGLCRLVGPPPCSDLQKDPVQQNHAPIMRTTLPFRSSLQIRLRHLFPPRGRQRWRLTVTLAARGQTMRESTGQELDGPQLTWTSVSSGTPSAQ